MTISERLRKAALGPAPALFRRGHHALSVWLPPASYGMSKEFRAVARVLDAGEDWSAFYGVSGNVVRMFLLFCAAAEEGNP